MRVRARKLTTFIDKTRGLMLSKENTPVYLETRFGIHTFFLKNSIDVVVLDKDFVIGVIRKGLKPGRVFFWNPKYFRVIEFPNKKRFPKGLEVGRRLEIELC